MILWTQAFFLICWLGLVAAHDVHGRITWNDICPGAHQLGRSKAVIDHGQYFGGIQQDGAFTIPDVPAGTYLLSVISHDFAFDQLRIDIYNATPPVVEVRPYVAGTPLNPASSVSLPYPVALVARQKHNYFVPHESFNLMAMFSNPMMMLMLVTAGMAIGAPYLMKNMDPGALDEMRANQAKIASAQSALANGDFKSGLSALLSDETSSQPQPKSASAAPSSGQNKSRSSKNKRR